MALSQDDLKTIHSIINREPSDVELSIFDTMWSEHCSYKSSKPVLKTLPTKGSEVALGVGEDSGIIRFTKFNGKQYCIVLSHESHNHPSQILPIEGAATGVGGVVRDVYCMGSDVIGVLNSLHFGINDPKDNAQNNPLIDEIAQKVVQGVSDYANPLGVPVLGGETCYHPSYNDNCLVNVAAVGLLEEDDIIHSYVPDRAKEVPYDVILFGKSTDATGFGGASFSSATLDKEDEMTNMGAVQVHDPFLKRVLAEAIKVLLKRVKDEKVEIGFKDLGAGGISCVTSELAVAAGLGIKVNLDHVNVAIKNLDPKIIACSETQERFCVVVPRDFSQTVLDIFNKEFELPKIYPQAGATIIGEVTEETDYVLTYRDEEVCRLPVEAITTDVKAERHAAEKVIKTDDQSPSTRPLSELQNLTKNVLSQFNNCSKRYVYRYFDNAVRGDSIVYPGEADAVVITPIKDCPTAVSISIDSNLYGEIDPYVSGAAAVAEGVRNVISVGGRPIAITDCLNYGNPENPDVFFDFKEGVRGIGDAAKSLGFIDGEALPIISGNVSFYNESKQGAAVIPSPVIMVLGRVEHINQVITMQIKKANLDLLLIGKRYSEFGGTQIKQKCEELNDTAPQFRAEEEAKANALVLSMIQDQKVASCHDISGGGAWMCVCEMLLGERGHARVGATLSLDQNEDMFSLLFSENGGYILALDPEHREEIENKCQEAAVFYSYLGQTKEKCDITVSQGDDTIISHDIASLKSQWDVHNDIV